MKLFQLKRLVVGASLVAVSAGGPNLGCSKDKPPEVPVVADAATPSPAPADVAAVAPTPAEGDEAQRPRAGLEAAPAAATAGILASPLLQLMPATSRFAVVANPARLFGNINVAGLLGALPGDDGPGRMLAQMATQLQLDVRDPATFAKAGIAIEREFAFALIDEAQDAFLVGFELTDSAAFVAWFEGVATKNEEKVLREQVGEMAILSLAGSRNGAVVVGPKAAWVMGHKGEAGTVSFARELLAAADSARLPAEPSFRKVAAQLGDVGVAVVVSPAWVREKLRPLREVETEWLQREIEAAKKRGDAEALAEHERVLKALGDEKVFENPDDALIRKLFEPVDAMGFGLVVGERKIVATGFIGLPADATLRRIGVPGGAFAIDRLVDPETLLVWAARVDPKLYLRTMLASVGPEEEVLAELRAGLQQALKLRLDEDFLDLLTGEIGAIVKGNLGAVALGGNEALGMLKMAGVLGLKDAAPFAATLEALAKLPDAASMGAAWEAETKRLSVPLGGTRLAIAAEDGRLVATNEPAWAERLKSDDKAGGIANFVADDAMAAALGSGRLVGMMAFSAKALEPMVSAGLSFAMEFGLWPPTPIDDDAGADEKKQWEAMNAAYEAARTERRAAMEGINASIGSLATGLGHGVYTLELNDAGAVMRFGQFMPATTTLSAWAGELSAFMQRLGDGGPKAGPAEEAYRKMRGEPGFGEDPVRPEDDGDKGE